MVAGTSLQLSLDETSAPVGYAARDEPRNQREVTAKVAMLWTPVLLQRGNHVEVITVDMAAKLYSAHPRGEELGREDGRLFLT